MRGNYIGTTSKPPVAQRAGGISFVTDVKGLIGDALCGQQSTHAPNAAVALSLLGLFLSATFEGFAVADASLHYWYCHANKQWRTICICLRFNAEND